MAWDWAAARSATVHCLAGCGLGEVLGMVIGQTLGLHTGVTIALAVALAFFFGILFGVIRIVRLVPGIGRAVRIAVAADVLSISVMEIVDNVVLAAIPGALHAGAGSARFWVAMAIALGVAFVVTLPVNAWLISRGRGHALVPHEHHHAMHG